MVWSPDPGAIGKRIEDLDTPALLLDLDKVERNLDTMARWFEASRVRVRPHTKTHKVPMLAHMQMERGAVGICCAKLGEAEAMADGGVSGILLTTEIVGAPKIRRLLGLARQVSVITVVDDARAAELISNAAVEVGLRLSCLVDINVGSNRTGAEPGEPALALALQVDRMPGLELIGVQGYEGHIQHIIDPDQRRAENTTSMQLLSQTVALLREKGLRTDIVSTAGTGTCQLCAQWDVVTEVQPGSYVVMDTDYVRVQGQFENALTVLTSVVTNNRRNTAIVDAGMKSLSTDQGQPSPRDLDATYHTRGDEHGKLEFANGNPLALGEKIELIPSHCDTTINLYDVYYVHRSGQVVAVWPIAGRGKVQ
jgi:D-serine deaminase-like pyridoxal phosphate-dependent protein